MRTVCIKIGGATVDAEGLLHELGKSLKKLMPDSFPVVIHGGGKDIARHLDLLNKEFTFVEGMRVTDSEMVKIVQMVLSGDVNKRIVNALLIEGVAAAGFSGVDSNLFTASKMTMRGQDIGFVGKIEEVNTNLISIFKQNSIVPVISPISGIIPVLFIMSMQTLPQASWQRLFAPMTSFLSLMFRECLSTMK